MATFSVDVIQRAIVEAGGKLGYAKLCPQQEIAVTNFLKGRDVFVCLPTGSGKSLCYCLLPAAFDQLRHAKDTRSQSVVVVVSPLIALMKDQVRAMRARRFCCVYGGSRRRSRA